jgi:cytoskeletal protein CcmA (bactofilin family)
MFRKNKNTTAARKVSSPSVIAADMNFLGNIISDGVVDCDGNVDGNIRCEILTVRQNGSVKGDITADTVLVYGKVNGLIRAKTVQLFASCHIEGIVMHESLSIEDGAFIDGKCKRTDKPLTAAPEEVVDAKEEAATVEKVKMLESIRLIR